VPRYYFEPGMAVLLVICIGALIARNDLIAKISEQEKSSPDQ
jgi:hypothetical protein